MLMLYIVALIWLAVTFFGMMIIGINEAIGGQNINTSQLQMTLKESRDGNYHQNQTAAIAVVDADTASTDTEHNLQGKQQQPQKKIDRVQSSPGLNQDHRRWAYVFLVGGIRGEVSDVAGLYSTVAITHALRTLGSAADFVVLAQLSAKTNQTRIQPLHEAV